MIGIVEKILNDEKVLVKGVDVEKILEVKVDKFQMAEFKELLEGEEPIIIVVNEENNSIVQDAEI